MSTQNICQYIICKSFLNPKRPISLNAMNPMSESTLLTSLVHCDGLLAPCRETSLHTIRCATSSLCRESRLEDHEAGRACEVHHESGGAEWEWSWPTARTSRTHRGQGATP